MRTLLLTLTTCLLVLPAQAKYSGGSGTAQDPYQIATAADLILLGESPQDHDKHFILAADIDLDPKLPGRKVLNKAVMARDANADTVNKGVADPPTYLAIVDMGPTNAAGRLMSGRILKQVGVAVGPSIAAMPPPRRQVCHTSVDFDWKG